LKQLRSEYENWVKRLGNLRRSHYYLNYFNIRELLQVEKTVRIAAQLTTTTTYVPAAVVKAVPSPSRLPANNNMMTPPPQHRNPQEAADTSSDIEIDEADIHQLVELYDISYKIAQFALKKCDGDVDTAEVI
jgi:NACalpha-BTF3-like transcription factor